MSLGWAGTTMKEAEWSSNALSEMIIISLPLMPRHLRERKN